MADAPKAASKKKTAAKKGQAGIGSSKAAAGEPQRKFGFLMYLQEHLS